MTKFDYYAELKKTAAEIVAEHPHLAGPRFEAVLANKAITALAPRYFAYKKSVLGVAS